MDVLQAWPALAPVRPPPPPPPSGVPDGTPESAADVRCPPSGNRQNLFAQTSPVRQSALVAQAKKSLFPERPTSIWQLAARATDAAISNTALNEARATYPPSADAAMMVRSMSPPAVPKPMFAQLPYCTAFAAWTSVSEWKCVTWPEWVRFVTLSDCASV